MAKKNKQLFRSVTFDVKSLDEDTRNIDLSFSSEEPYARYSSRYDGEYYEVLGHDNEEIDLSFLASGRAPLLRDHDPLKQIGVVSSVQISEGRGRAKVKLSQNEEGQRELTDILDGIRVNVSVGYYIEEEKVVGERDGKKIVRATKWRPVEVSTVSIPADETVGVGRKAEDSDEEEVITETPIIKEKKMDEKKVENQVDVESITREARKAEQARVREIASLGEKYGMSKAADEFVRNDKGAEEFRAYVLENLDLSAKKTEVKAEKAEDSSIGLSEKEARSYSFMKAIKAQVDPRYAKEAGFEIEASRAMAEKMGVEPKGILVPHDVLQIRAPLSAGGSSNGANFVATDLLAGSFIDLLRNRLVTAEAGATILTGLRGNVAIPKANVGATAYWVDEVTAPTASDPKTTQITMSPKTLGTYVDATRQFVFQSSLDVENYLRNELAKTLAIEIDRVGLYGNTSLSEPEGITLTTGVDTSVAFATAATPTFANVHAMVSAVEVDNALEGNLAFIAAPGVKGNMATTSIDSGSGRFVYENGAVAGYRCLSSNQVTAGDLFFGDFSSLIFGMWGGLDLVVDTAALATTGGIRVIALQSIDCAVKHGESFAFAQ